MCVDPVADDQRAGSLGGSADANLHLLLQGITDYAIYMLDVGGTVLTWNPGAERAHGYNFQDIHGQHFSCFYSAEDRCAQLPQADLAAALKDNKFEAEGWRYRKNGSRFWAYVIIEPIRDGSGQHIGFANVVKDCTEWRRDQDAIATVQHRYRLLVQGVSDYAIYTLDADGHVSNWNPGAERAKGYTSEEIMGQHFACFYSAEDRAEGHPQQALDTALLAGKFEAEGWRYRKDGSRFWAHFVIKAILDDSGAHQGFATITRDITDRKLQGDRLQDVTRTLDLALSNMSQGLCFFDEAERLVMSNDQFKDLLNIDRASVSTDRSFRQICHQIIRGSGAPDHAAQLQADFMYERHRALIRREQRSSVLEELRDGRVISFSHRAMPGAGWITTIDDVSEERRSQARIAHMAHHDALTDLPNRILFRQRLHEATAALGSGERCAVLFLDLDRFKIVNDTFGHPKGDLLLGDVATRLRALVRKEDTVARLGGDEFALVLRSFNHPYDATTLAQRLLTELSAPYLVGGDRIIIGTSIGIAMTPHDGSDPDGLLRSADMALYSAKSAGRGQYRFFDPEMDAAMQQRRHLEIELRAAIAADEFELYYQPIANLPGRNIIGFEALLRWNSPGRGIVPPSYFVPLAEETGLIVPIGRWVLETACHEAASWPSHVSVAVNLSPVQFGAAGIVDTVRRVLETTGLAPGRLQLEITETAMMTNSEHTLQLLHQLKALGVKIAMDDFGTGYSSLSHLRSFPFDKVKIDRSFVNELNRKKESTAIVRTVSSLCKWLGVVSTAEGVETEEQLEMLRDSSCMEVQGYLISRPCPAASIPLLLADSADTWPAPHPDPPAKARTPRLVEQPRLSSKAPNRPDRSGSAPAVRSRRTAPA